MRNARLIAAISVALFVGVAAGWYFGYTRPIAQGNREARKQMDAMEHDDSMTVAFALATIRALEAQRSETARELLAKPLASYYVIYGPPDNPKKRISEDRMQMLKKIEEAAATYPFVQAAIDESKQNVAK